MTKFNCFLKNAEMLNNKFNIVPLLYGSLGLEVLTNSSLNADDIDILIPQVFVTGNRWTVFKLFLESEGYERIVYVEKNWSDFVENTNYKWFST